MKAEEMIKQLGFKGDDEEKYFIQCLMWAYAKEKCKEQRETIQAINPHHTDYTNAPEPNFD